MEVNEVKRFDPWTDMWGVFGGMNQKATGDWVDYDDYAKLEATIAELTRERDELREASRWIPVDMAKMEAGTVCDLWEPFHGRLSNYRLVKNYAGKSGNHFFEPVSSGLSCVRTATHYIGIPKGPTL